MITRALIGCGFACLLCLSGAVYAGESKLPPMDAAAGQDHLPDTVTPDGIHIGSWSASAPKASPAKPAPAPEAAPAAQDHLPDQVLDNGMHVGSWSANSPPAKTSNQAMTFSDGAKSSNDASAAGGDNSGEEKLPESHSLTVTSIQTCYDQLDPADAADVKKNFLKPYAECQARLEAKREGKRELKQGEAQQALVPDSPRNYVRVQQPEKAPEPANMPAKSEIKTNP